MTYDLTQVKLEGIESGGFINLTIEQVPNQHGELNLTAYGKEEQNIDELKQLQPIVLYVEENSNRKNLFCGVLTEVAKEEVNGDFIITLKAKTYSYLMDLEKKSRSFQNTLMTYTQLLKKILKEYQGSDCISTIKDLPIGNLAVQYKETDWEFLKRIFSMIYIPLAVEMEIPSIRIYAGIPELEMQNNNYEVIEATMDFQQFDYLNESGCNLKKSSCIAIQIELQGFSGIYTSYVYKGIPLVVGGIKTCISKGLITTKINLRPKEGIVVAPCYPMHLIGLALEGSVIAVQGNQVKIHFLIDNPYKSKDVYWFTFSTPSASPDGSGWYCMPEKGDRLRVYFPTKNMQDVIAISSISSYQGNDGSDRMGNPNTKYLRSPTGQELNMGSDGISLSSAGDTANLKVGNDGIISAAGMQLSIMAIESIDITADAAIKFHSKTGAQYKSTVGGSIELNDVGNLDMVGIKLNVD